MQNNFINDLIAKLPYVFGSEVEYLRELGKTFTPDTKVLMLGVGPGEMALLLHDGASQTTKEIRNVLGDPPFMFDFYAVDNSSFDTYISHMTAAGFRTGLMLNYNTDDIYHEFKDEYFDVVIVDASHTYESVKKDIEHYWFKLKYDGLMLFHDYIKLESDNGVKEAIEASITDEWQEIAQVGISIVFLKRRTGVNGKS